MIAVNESGWLDFAPCWAHGDPDDPTPIRHKPGRIVNEGVLISVECIRKERVKEAVSRGTHLNHLDKEARERRQAKNARNRKRQAEGNATHVRGTQRKGR